MNTRLLITNCLAAGLMAGGAAAQQAGVPAGDPAGPVDRLVYMPGKIDPSGFCRYPLGRAGAPQERQPLAAAGGVNEAEPNNTAGSAQGLNLGLAPGADADVDVSGTINTSDADFFSISVRRGDVLGMAAVSSTADLLLDLRTANNVMIKSNDQHAGAGLLYPPESPLPSPSGNNDAILSWVAPSDGTFLLRVTSFAGSGAYTLQLRLRRPGMEATPQERRQVVFLDFDGATINPFQLFGLGPDNNVMLGPMRNALAGWGLANNTTNENAVIDAIVTTVRENFDSLRTQALNGSHPDDLIPGHFDIELLNSRDHADPFGQPNVSRVIIGGTVTQLGFSTLGIAQWIDPGNFSLDDTAVVLLDGFSDDAGNTDSVNSIARAQGTTIIDAIGLVIGYTVSHEAGHYLGNWHTDNSNGTPCVMDSGGQASANRAGVGPDGTLGTADDIDVDFGGDTYSPFEIFFGTERTDVRCAFGLATGASGTVYVEAGAGSPEDGSRFFPFNTVAEGHAVLPSGGAVLINAANYPELLTLDRPGLLVSRNGSATIGP